MFLSAILIVIYNADDSLCKDMIIISFRKAILAYSKYLPYLCRVNLKGSDTHVEKEAFAYSRSLKN